jgi:hypothetical protein
VVRFPTACVPRLGALLLAAIATAGSALADLEVEEKKFPQEAYPPEFRRRVNAAIDRGAHWLLSVQRGDGSWEHASNGAYSPGASALATLALLKAGLPADHPRVDRAFAHLRSMPFAKTYTTAIVLMALDARYEDSEETFAKEEVDRYGHRVVKSPCEQRIPKEDLEWMKDGVKFLLENQTKGHWRYPTGGLDLSNTQYALLGLKAAVRCGIKVPVEAWLDSLEWLLGWQEKDGPEVAWRANEVRGDYRIEWTEKAKARGFGYSLDFTTPTGSMTTAGVAGLLICQSELWPSRRFTGDLREQTRNSIRDGLAWMQENFSVTTNPGFPDRGRGGISPHLYYYLYGLERMGILGNLRFMGPHDWYDDGAEFLMHEQSEAGCWMGGDPVETSFAILFLKRASFRSSNPAITPSEPSPAPAGGK